MCEKRWEGREIWEEKLWSWAATSYLKEGGVRGREAGEGRDRPGQG